MFEQHHDSIPRYEVRLSVFNGPMDVLLHLIERGQLDITLVSLASVTEQYIAYVQEMPEPDPDQLADFLVIASKLLAIKANALFARPSEAPTDDEEDAEELLRALRDYQLFKHVAEDLRVRESADRRAYPRAVPCTPVVRTWSPDGLTIEDLLAALRRRLAFVPAAPALMPVPQGHEYTVPEKVVAIERHLAEVSSACFGDLVAPGASRLEVIVTFLALLELLKLRRVTATQTAVFSKIEIIFANSADQDRSTLGTPQPALAGSR